VLCRDFVGSNSFLSDPYVTVKGGLFFRRIGFSALVERSIALPIYELIIHRSFMEVATTIFCTIITIAAATPLLRSVRLVLVGIFILVVGSYFSFVLLNNRFQSAIFFGDPDCLALLR